MLKQRAFEFKHTPMIGRTHGIHAEPITFGLKLANWYAEIERNIERLDDAAEQMRVGKISGAVGNCRPPRARVSKKKSARAWGSNAAPVSSQVIQRDRHAFYVATLAVIAASLDKIALEVRGLQRTEVREAEEYFSAEAEGLLGHAAQAQSRRPASRSAGWRAWCASNAQAALENVALWHERDISHSSVERVILPDSTILLDYLLHKTANLVETHVRLSRAHAGESGDAPAGWSSPASCCSIWWRKACCARMPTAWCSATPCARGRTT